VTFARFESLAAFAELCAALLLVAYVARAARTRLASRVVLLAFAAAALLPPLCAALAWFGGGALVGVRITRPWLGLSAAALALFGIVRLGNLSTRQSRGRRLLTEFLLSLSVVACAWSAAGIEAGRPLDRLAVIVAIDRSRSTDLVPDYARRVRAELDVLEVGMRSDDRVAIVAFGSDASLEDPLRGPGVERRAQHVSVGRDATDIAAAIRRTLAEIPADSAARVVLMSDGRSTRGDALHAAAAAIAAGVPIDAVPLEPEAANNVGVLGVRAPSRAAKGEPIELRAALRSSRATRVELRVYRDGELIQKGPADLRRGETVVRLREVAESSGLARYDVEVSALDPGADDLPDDNRGSTFVRVTGTALALVLDAKPEQAAPLAEALERGGLVVATKGVAGVPIDVAEMAAYDLIALGDVSAAHLAPEQLDALLSYVRDLGGGLLLLGGDASMGPGGYGRTPVEEASPVSFDLKQERRRASLAQVIAVDYSGSMSMDVGGRTKLDLANEAAVRSAELLGSGDRLGVMHVDTAVSWTVPLARVTDQAAIARRIRAVGAGNGGIFVDLALAAAYEALGREKVNLRHVLLFADGADAEERSRAPALVAEARRQRITTSIVALGRGDDVPDLERLSRAGGGRFYLIEDAARLPAVFAQETILASRSSINEVAFRPGVGEPSGITRGVDFTAAPPLTGYVVTIVKPRAQLLLEAAEGDPLLAAWSLGLGRAGAFTSDYQARWGAAWTSWPGAARLFAQLGRDLARRDDDPRVEVSAEVSGDRLLLEARVVDDIGRAESFRPLTARVAGPGGFAKELRLDAAGPGAYRGEVELSRPGAYMATLLDEAVGKTVATTGAILSAGEELRSVGPDRALLRRIAALTGGRVRDTLAGTFEDRELERMAYRPFTPAFVLLAAIALLLGVAARRLALPEALVAMPAAFLARWQRPRPTSTAGIRPAPPLPQLKALERARARQHRPAEPTRLGTLAPRPATHAPESPRSPSVSVERDAEGPLPSASPRQALTAAEILLARRRRRR
jgi:uncharacterized membrane protein